MAGGGEESYTQWGPPTVRGPAGMGDILGETRGGGRGGMEGNLASVFPVHLGTGEFPGLILFPRSLPPAAQSPSPAPTPPPRALPLHSETPSESPSNHAGPKPHPHALTQGLTSKLGNSTFRGPSVGGATSPLSRAGPKQGSAPCLNITLTRPCPTLKSHPHHCLSSTPA